MRAQKHRASRIARFSRLLFDSPQDSSSGNGIIGDVAQALRRLVTVAMALLLLLPLSLLLLLCGLLCALLCVCPPRPCGRCRAKEQGKLASIHGSPPLLREIGEPLQFTSGRVGWDERRREAGQFFCHGERGAVRIFSMLMPLAVAASAAKARSRS